MCAQQEPNDPHDPVAGSTAASAGMLLSGTHLLNALEQQERIFRRGSWSSAQIKGACYDLRLGGEWLVIPSRDNDGHYHTIGPGGLLPDREVQLMPGQSAVLATEEKWAMAFDVTAIIGPKFRLSARGLLLLHGMAAHPGFGRHKTTAGRWQPDEDTRLHLIVINMGPKVITLRQGDAIAAAKFFSIAPTDEPQAVESYGFEQLKQRFFQNIVGGDSAAGGIGYFKPVLDLSEELAAERAARVELEGRVSLQFDDVRSDLSRVRSATDNVVVFGVFLVAATLLGISLTALVDVVQGLPPNLDLWQVLVIGGITCLYASLIVVAFAVMIRATRRIVQG